MSVTQTHDWMFAERPSSPDDGAPHSLAPDLAWLRTGIVNVACLGLPDAGDRGWVLGFAGLPGMAYRSQKRPSVARGHMRGRRQSC